MGLRNKLQKYYFVKLILTNHLTLLRCVALGLVGFILIEIYVNYSAKEVAIIHYPRSVTSTHATPQKTSSTYFHQSFNPVRCHKCTNNSTSQVLDPNNWIPNEPFVYYRPFGGLGNQLFQYACGYTLAKKNKLPLLVYVDGEPGSEDNQTFRPEPFHLSLHLFHIPLPGYDREKVNIIEEFIDKADNESRVDFLYDESILTQSYQISDKILRIYDYCQSEYFFLPYRDEIRRFYKPRILNSSRIIHWMKEINRIDQTHDSVCIHIRRGDFTDSPDRLVNTTFYTTAMDEIRQRLQRIGKVPEFFLFSDDISNVEEDFEELLPPEDFEKLHLVSDSETTLVEDLYLMSQCRHNIISESSFGWWGAYLNDFPEQIVIAAHFKLELSKDDPYTTFLHRNMYYPPSWFVREAEYANR